MTPTDMRARADWMDLIYGPTDLAAMLRQGAEWGEKVERLRAVFRVNMLRYGPPGTSHEEIDALLNGLAIPTEYERKVAQMKEDFPNGI